MTFYSNSRTYDRGRQHIRLWEASWLTTGHLLIVAQRGLELTGTERIFGSAVDNYWAIKRHTRNPRRADNT